MSGSIGLLAIGEGEIGVAGSTPNPGMAMEQTSLTQIIPSYAYTQYADDDNILAFVQAYNEYATQFLNWFLTLNLPIYTGGLISGALLDWVAQGIYGISRPSITSGSRRSVDATNAYPIDAVATNNRRISSTETLQSTTDDLFRRVITWNFYKGDGLVFSIPWLKRRVLRFLNGANGISPVIDQTYAVSVTISGPMYAVTVASGDSTMVSTLNSLIQSGACATPFQYSFTVST